jgi:hypothetical protein
VAVPALFVLALVLIALALAGSGGGTGAPPVAIELRDRIPVGVQRSRAGALAAADNYLAESSQTLEQEPAAFARLVAQIYEPSARAQTLAQAQALRSADLSDMATYGEGGRGIAVVAARRLDSYSPNSATVTSWLAGFLWGPRVAARQSWNLVDTTLAWRFGRWLVVSCQVDAAPAPVPAIVYARGADDSAGAFARLAGMTAPFYGAG